MPSAQSQFSRQFFHHTGSQKVPQNYWPRYIFFLFLMVAGTALVAWVYPPIDHIIVTMIYLLLNVIVAVNFGLRPSIVSAVVSVVSFDFFIAAPQFAFTVLDGKDWVIFVILFVVTMVTSRLTVQSRKSAQDALDAEIKAEREKVISSLASSVSHDLKTPLTVISGASSTLLENEGNISNEDKRYLLETINNEALRLGRLVSKILQFTKIESGNVIVRKEIHLLNDIVGSVLNRMESVLGDRPITVEIPNDLKVPLDDLLIEQVFVNLLENVARYTPNGSELNIRAFCENGYAWVEINDRGPGIPRQEKSQIFEKFNRGNKQDDWGTGLGLSVCQGIVKIHQGKIGVRSRVGGGSTFYFSLPLDDSIQNKSEDAS